MWKPDIITPEKRLDSIVICHLRELDFSRNPESHPLYLCIASWLVNVSVQWACIIHLVSKSLLVWCKGPVTNFNLLLNYLNCMLKKNTYMHAYMHTHTDTHTLIYTHIYSYSYIHAYIQTHIFLYTDLWSHYSAAQLYFIEADGCYKFKNGFILLPEGLLENIALISVCCDWCLV